MKRLAVKMSTLPVVMKLIRNRRSNKADMASVVSKIIKRVRKEKDSALFDLTEKFDGPRLRTLRVSKREIAAAYAEETQEVISALRTAKNSIEKFHKTTVRKKEPAVVVRKGVKVWREFRPIRSVGLYIPGGKAAYPSTVLMLAIPAQIAGCREIVLCVPPGKDGKIPGAVLVAADMCGISNIFKVGGAQAIAAMAYGTGTIPKVSKIFGPGNQYVTTAKLQVYGEVDIDMPAGPSEVLVFADETANPSWVAADLLSQLEHGEDSQAILVTLSKTLGERVLKEINTQREVLPRKTIISESLKKSFAIVADSFDTAIALINDYAPEHLEIILKDEKKALEAITDAGSVFLGPYTSEPLGDYATGANHTLPTSGYAKMFSALSVESFGKKMQVQRVSREGIKGMRNTVETLAKREGLSAHKNAVSIRFKKNI